ncbi:MAG: addiction module protein, partial [Rhodoferax sp.]|uniref:addiction module protein n=1 Tax=Rhodoferax sp. TaxID=50421 RepID=UPI003BB55D70
EKLKLMEALWDSLNAQTDKDVESPAWHEAALQQAEDDLTAGTVSLVDWAEAKDSLRKSSRV